MLVYLAVCVLVPFVEISASFVFCDKNDVFLGHKKAVMKSSYPSGSGCSHKKLKNVNHLSNRKLQATRSKFVDNELIARH